MARELEALAAGGVVAGDVPERVRQHYARQPVNDFPVLGVLGATLVALGVILILAHNWSALPAAARAGISLGGLLGAQAFAAFALRRSDAAGWQEAAGIVATLAVVCAAALIDQTYQVASPVDVFLWQCAILALPMVLVLHSRGAAVLVLAAAWTTLFRDFFAETAPHRFWVLAGAVAAFAAWLHTRREPLRAALRDSFLGWAVVATLLLGATLNGGAHLGAALVLVLATTAAGLIGWGSPRLDAGDTAFLNHPAARLGGLGLGALVVTFSIGETWDIFFDDLDVAPTLAGLLPSVVLALAGGTLAARALLAWLRAGRFERALQCALPVALAGGWAIAACFGAEVAAFAVTLYGLAVGVGAMLSGMRDDSARRANLGLLLVGAVVGTRFLDDDWSFVVRGLAFVALGAAFLFLNLRMQRARAEVTS